MIHYWQEAFKILRVNSLAKIQGQTKEWKLLLFESDIIFNKIQLIFEPENWPWKLKKQKGPDAWYVMTPNRRWDIQVANFGHIWAKVANRRPQANFGVPRWCSMKALFIGRHAFESTLISGQFTVLATNASNPKLSKSIWIILGSPGCIVGVQDANTLGDTNVIKQ